MEKKIDKILDKEALKAVFQKVGVSKGMTLIAHTAMSKFNYIVGGAQTYNDALIETLGYSGTLVMPMQCAENSEPSYFENPPVAFDLLEDYRKAMPPFNKHLSETFMMGKAVENLRRREKAVISDHPNCAFVAVGKYARMILERQSLDFPLGNDSPLKKLYDLKAYCLLAGVDFDNMTALHLSEYLSNTKPIIMNGASIMVGGEKEFKKYLEYEIDSSDGFMEIGKILENKGYVNSLTIDNVTLKLVRVDLAVDEGIKYYRKRDL